MKICPLRTEFLHANGQIDGRTDMMNLIIVFHNFAKAPNGISVTSNNVWHLLVTYFLFAVYSVTVAMYQTRGIQFLSVW